MNDANTDTLVSTDWLAAHLSDPHVKVVDGSWHMPALKRDPRAEFLEKHIPGAAFFDIDDIADKSNPLPHMVPDAETFAAKVGALGIGNDDHVVVYDTVGLSSAARVWWTFRLFGHARVSVLDGGLPKWLAENRPVDSGAPAPTPKPYSAKLDRRLLRSLDDIRANIESGREQILDARSAGRFRGVEPEPRQGLRGGHIPGSFSLPYTDLIDPETRTVRPADALAEAFERAGIRRDRPVVTSCGSGVTACVLALGLAVLGRDDGAVYDGSWTEWGGRDDTPVETEETR